MLGFGPFTIHKFNQEVVFMEKKAKLERNLKLYAWFQMFREPLFWGPIAVKYMCEVSGMSLPELFFAEAVALLGVAVMEVPTGSLADHIGRKKTLMLGTATIICYMLVFAFANSPRDIWIGNFLWVIGFTLCSNADNALLYDSLLESKEKRDIESLLKEIEGKAYGRRYLVMAGTSLLAGVLYDLDPRLTLLFSMPGIAISFVLTCFLEEPLKTESYRITRQLAIVWNGTKSAASSPIILWIIGFMVLLNVSSLIWFFCYNPYFDLVKLDVKKFGVIFSFMNLIAWFFSVYSHSLEKKVGAKASILGMFVLIGAPIYLMGSFVSIYSIGLVTLQNVVRGFMLPFFSYFLNRYVSSEIRATVNSLRSAAIGFGGFVGLGVFEFLLKSNPLEFGLQVLGIGVLASGAIFIFWHGKLFRE